MAQLLKNNAFSTLSLSLTSGGTSMTLVDASAFPAPTGGDYFLATLIGFGSNGAENSWEIVRCTARASNTLTIVRAQEGTTAQAWPAATQVQMRLTAGSMATKADLASPAFTGTVTGITKAMVGLGSVDNTADSAKVVASAAKLTTARTIGGVSFDGTANINLPGVNAAGDQNTTGNAATATALQTARTINGVSFDGTANITVADSTKLPLTGGTATGAIYTRGSFGMRSSTIPGNPIMYDVADQAGALVMELGRLDGIAATTAIDIHTGTGVTDYDTRLAFTGGTGVTGGGNFNVQAAGFTWNGFTVALASSVNAKQDTLVSGTNIKTVNGSSLLGSGNLSITAGIADAPSDGKQYARKDAAWAEVSGLSVGDFMTTMRALSAPDWLAPDGSAYLQASYPELFSLLGLAANDMFAAKLTVPGAPAAYTNGCKWSADGGYLAFATRAGPYLLVYSRSGTTLTKLSNPSPPLPGYGNDAALDGTGSFVAAAHNESPYISVYQISGSSVTKIDDPATLPTGAGNGCSWDDSGTFLAVAHATSPFITVYERSGTTLTKLPNPASLPPAECKACQWDASGKYLVVAHINSPFITVYERSGTTLTKLPNPASLPEGNGAGAACDASGTLFSVAIGVSPYIVTYRREGSTLSRLANPAVLPVGTPNGCSWTQNGKLLAVSHATSPFITVYERSGSTLTKLTNPSSLPPGAARSCSFASNGAFLAVTNSNGSSYAEVYRNSNYDTATSFVVPSYAAPAGAPVYMKAKP